MNEDSRLLEDRQKIISKLTAARIEKGISQQELADRIGTKRSNICRIESGAQNISLDMLLRLSSALGKDVSVVLNDKEEEFLAKSSSDKAEAQYLLEKYSSSFGEWLIDNGFTGYSFANDETKKTIEKAYQDYLNSLRDRIAIADKTNEQASEDYLKWSLDYMMGEGRDYMEGVAENLIEGLGEWYKFGDKGETSLSALQAGIQGITEDTAGALEAITNGMYQQVTLQSDILQQINATLQNFDLDIQTATLSQILLQLQSSYILQQSILSTMENWTTPSGNAVKVELIS